MAFVTICSVCLDACVGFSKPRTRRRRGAKKKKMYSVWTIKTLDHERLHSDPSFSSLYHFRIQYFILMLFRSYITSHVILWKNNDKLMTHRGRVTESANWIVDGHLQRARPDNPPAATANRSKFFFSPFNIRAQIRTQFFRQSFSRRFMLYGCRLVSPVAEGRSARETIPRCPDYYAFHP